MASDPVKFVMVILEPTGQVTIKSSLDVVDSLAMLRLAVAFHRLGNEFMASAIPSIRDDATARY